MDRHLNKMLLNLLLAFFVAIVFVTPVSIADVQPDAYKPPRSPYKPKPPSPYKPPSTVENEAETQVDGLPQGYHKPPMRGPPKHGPPMYKPPPKHKPPNTVENEAETQVDGLPQGYHKPPMRKPPPKHRPPTAN